MAGKKEISDADLADLLDKDIPVTQIAELCHTTERQIRLRIQHMKAETDTEMEAVLEAAVEDAVKDSDGLTFDKIVHPNARALLLAYAKTGNLTASIRVAGIGRQTHYNWIESLAGYADAFAQAKEMYADLLESSAHTRAVIGVVEPVYQLGFKIGEIRKYSDTLLLALLKAKKPDEYKERTETTHAGRVQYAHSIEGDLDALSVDDVKTLRDISRKMGDNRPEGGG